MASALCRHLGIAQADNELHRLVLAISGLGVMLHIGADVITAMRPQLLASHAALDRYAECLVAYAMDLVNAEAQRRAKPATLQPTSPA